MGSELTQFKPGQSGNPSGRPKGFKALAKSIHLEATEDEFINFAFEIFRGTSELQRTFGQRWEAFLWLTDRGFGKAPQLIELHTTEEPAQNIPDLSELSDEELKRLDEAAAIIDRAKHVIDV